MQTSKLFLLGCAVFFAFTAMAASEPAELANLRAKFGKAMDRATEALTIFWPSYKHQLEELKAKAQSQGNLEGVLAVEAEMKLADQQTIGKNSKYEPLKNLQAELAGLRSDLEKQVAPDKKRLYDIYFAALQTLEVSLTKETRLDDAIAVRSEGEQVKKWESSGAMGNAAFKPGASAAAIGAGFTNSLGMKFVAVPGTTIYMCAHDTRRQDYSAYARENPGVDMKWEHTIKGKLPVGGGDDHPVVNMNWQDAAAFCEWLSKKEGITYRLPTDQEWSCAVGIGEREPKDATPEALTMEFPGEYPWGRDWPPPKGAGNFADAAFQEKFPNEKSIEGYSDGYATTSPVMSFPPNKLGIYDLVGNVWQWCQDWYNPAHKQRVLRGGSFDSHVASNFLSCRRIGAAPETRQLNYGFRCVATTMPKTSAQNPSSIGSGSHAALPPKGGNPF